MCSGKGVGRGMPVPATITKQTKIVRSTVTSKAHNGKLTGVNLVLHQLLVLQYYTVNNGSINKDDISKLLCLSMLFNVTKPI